jgi:hypothetical protein
LEGQLLYGGGTFARPPAPIKGNMASKNDPRETVFGFFWRLIGVYQRNFDSGKLITVKKA